ncbi:MAG: hypothetical protein ABSA92_07505 [Candidatus Bathyarchaeia archaeon]|jgi:hypothetical protein
MESQEFPLNADGDKYNFGIHLSASKRCFYLVLIHLGFYLVTCGHHRQREVGQGFDEDGRLLRLARCQKCGLIMREYVPAP